MDGRIASFRDVESLMFEFEAVLERHGIDVKPESQLGRACLAVMDSLYKHEQPEVREAQADVRPSLTYALGLWEFMKKVVRLQSHIDFKQLIPHLEQMNNGGFLQNIKAGTKEGTDQVPAKMFELLIAMAAMDIGHDLKLDHPENPKGDNPDVIVTIDGVCWAFACKMMMGASPITLFDRIKEGIEQIDRVAVPRGPVQRGVVVVNLKNRLDHDKFWPILNEDDYRKGDPPIFGTHLNAVPVAQALADIATEQMREMEKVSTMEQVVQLFASSVASPAILLFLQTSMSILTIKGPVPSTFPLLLPYRYKELSEPEAAVFASMYDALHNRAVRAST